MSKIIILCGRSGSGKDTMFQKIIATKNFMPIISTTSRPIRDGEKQGREYNFITKDEFLKKIDAGTFFEYRAYDTKVDGKPDTWYYGSETVDLTKDKNYIVILDIQGAKTYIEHYGRENCLVAEITVNDEVREERAKLRGGFDKTEWDRRVEDDMVKFSREAKAGVVDIAFDNTYDADTTFDNLIHWIEKKTENSSAIPQILDIIMSDNTFKGAIADSIQTAITSAIERSFSFGDLNRAIEKRISATFVPCIENYDMAKLIPKLDTVMTAIANTKVMNDYTTIVKNFRNLMQTPTDGFKGTSLSTIFDKYCDYVKSEIEGNYDMYDLEKDEYDENKYAPIVCTMEVADSSRSSYSTRYDISMKAESGLNMEDFEFEFTLYDYGNNDLSLSYHGDDITIRDMRHLDPFRLYLLQLQLYGSVKLDEHSAIRDVELEIDN